MEIEVSITDCLGAMKRGDQDAVRLIWEAYSRRLMKLARDRLRDSPRGLADEEDVALDAFDSFCRGVDVGRFPRLEDRDDLWQILAVITVRKAIDFRQKEGRLRRGGGRLRSLAELTNVGLDPSSASEPGPEMAAIIADEYRTLMARLKDPSLQVVVNLKLEGFTNAEVADRLGCVETTVERKLGRIRRLWGDPEEA